MKKMSERDVDNLSAILDYCDRIEKIYNRIEKSKEVFFEDEVFKDALLMNVVQIGECANRLSDECREELSDLPWNEIIGTRNIIVHGYARINNDIIWNVIENDICELKRKIEEIL